MASTDDLLRRMSREWAASVVKRAQPVLATVSATTDNGLLHINIEGDETGTGNVPEVATPNGSYDYQVGDRILVSRSRSKALPHQVIGFYYNDNDSTYYPRQKTDYIKAPGGTLEVEATDITLNGDSIVLDGKVKISSNDTTPGYLEDKINTNSGVSSFTDNDGDNEQLFISLDIDGLTADGSPDGANDYVATYDASAGGIKKVLLDNLPGGGDVTGPASSTDNAIVRWDGTGGDTLQDSGPTISDGGKLTLPDSASIAPLSVTERSSEPSSPAAGDVYLDDGTNTASSNPGWRRYTGAAWEDVSAAAGGTDPHAIHDNVADEFSGITEKAVILNQDDSFLLEDADDSYAKKMVFFDYVAVSSLVYCQTNGLVRELLTADRTYYVRTDGSDSNTGLTNSAGGAFLTIQKAIDVCAETLDFGGYTVTIQVGDGTYTGAVAVKAMVGMAGPNSLVINGNSGTPSNVVISTTSAHAVSADGPTVMAHVKYLKVQTTTSGMGISVVNKATLLLSGVNFGTCANYHMLVNGAARVQLVAGTGYTISGGAAFHFFVVASTVQCESVGTVTLSGTPGFTTFAYVSDGNLRINGNTYSGSATGSRYNANLNGVIFTNGGGATYLPGSTAGATSTGGQYA